MKKVFAILICCALLLCVAAGCASGSKSEDSISSPEFDIVGQRNEADESAAVTDSSMSPAKEGSGEVKTVDVTDTRKLIKTVSLQIETKEYDKYLGALRAAITANGGYIEQSRANSNGFYDNGNRNSSLTARIPSDKLDAFLAVAGKNGKITSQEENISDVTLDYVDTQSRINALKTERDSLTKLLTQAGSLENIIAIQTRLSEVNYQIESYESQMRALDNQISYSTVDMNINEVERVSAEDESLGRQIKTKLLNNLSNIRDDANDFVVAFIGGLPYLIIWSAVAVVAVLIIKAAVKKRRKNKAKAGSV